jgi:hypothetical protein
LRERFEECPHKTAEKFEEKTNKKREEEILAGALR